MLSEDPIVAGNSALNANTGGPFAWMEVECVGSVTIDPDTRFFLDGLSMRAGDDSVGDMQWLYNEPDKGWWAFSHGTSPKAFTTIAVSGANAVEGRGHAWAFNGMFVGRQKTMVTNGTEQPTGSASRQGDIVFNRAVTQPGDVSYWQCTESGTPGTWVAHRL